MKHQRDDGKPCTRKLTVKLLRGPAVEQQQCYIRGLPQVSEVGVAKHAWPSRIAVRQLPRVLSSCRECLHVQASARPGIPGKASPGCE
jgi:hypothetical protein